MIERLQNIEDFVQYFRDLVAEYPEAGTLVYGSSERVVRRQSYNMDYPLVWLAMPDVIIQEDNNERYSSTLFFLTDATNEEGEEDDAIIAMYALARKFHLRLKADANNGMFDYGSTDVVLQVKARTDADNSHGYVMDFDLIFFGQDCD